MKNRKIGGVCNRSSRFRVAELALWQAENTRRLDVFDRFNQFRVAEPALWQAGSMIVIEVMF
jgi:hypothetical protein